MSLYNLKAAFLSIFGYFYLTAVCVSQNASNLLVDYYSPRTYEGHPQVWSIVEDRQDILYIATGFGVISYDGVEWKKVNGTDKTVRSLAVSKDGTIFVGSQQDIGYLDEVSGELHFRSLLPNLDSLQKEFADVWKIHTTSEGVYFQSFQSLIRWHNGQMKVWKPAISYHFSFVVDDQLFIKENGKGIKLMEEEALVLLQGTETLAADKVYSITAHDDSSLLIATGNRGFFLYELQSQKLRPYDAPINEVIIKEGILSALRLKSGYLAIGTRSGFYISNSKGIVVNSLDSRAGLPKEPWISLMESRNGLLWAGLNQGIAKVHVNNPISFWNQKYGLEGTVLSTAPTTDQIYVGTTLGLYYLEEDRFVRSQDIHDFCFDLLVVESPESQRLLVGTSNSIYEVDEKGSKKVVDIDVAFDLYQSDENPDRVFVATRSGIVILKWNSNDWIIEEKVEGVTEQIRSIVEFRGDLWLATDLSEVIRIRAINSSDETIVRYGQLPRVSWVGKFQDNITLGTMGGIYKYDSIKDLFKPYDGFPEYLIDGSHDVSSIHEIYANEIWVTNAKSSNPVLSKLNAFFLNTYKEIKELSLVADATFYDVGHHKEKTWFGGTSGLFMYDHKKRKESFNQQANMIIRKVKFGSKTTSINANHAKHLDEIAHPENNISFDYTLTDYIDEGENRYSYYLNGLESKEQWSNWSNDSKIMYTNLPAGDYLFQVKGRNVYGIESKIASYFFRISPPWYATWYAILSYLMCLSTGIFFLLKVNRKLMKRSRERLEEVIRQRTKEIVHQKEEIEVQNIRLTELNTEIKHLMGIVAHDLKNPLITVYSIVQLLKEELSDTNSSVREYITEIDISTQELIDRISDVLDINALESKKPNLEIAEINPLNVLKEVIRRYRKLASEKSIKIEKNFEGKAELIFVDKYYLVQVYENLLSNAIKFSPQDSTVLVNASYINHKLRIEIIDFGPGIKESEKGMIFQRFARLSNEPTGGEKSTGLGLFIAKKYVDLMKGNIWYESGSPIGSRFIIEF